MKTRIAMTLLWAVIALTAAQVAQSQSLVIDDFTTGEHEVTLRSGEEMRYQSGAMVGGVRRTYFIVSSHNPFNQPSTLDIRRNGPLVISSGLKSFWASYLFYGFGLEGQLNPLSLNLTGYDRFRINFDSSDLTLSYLIQVFDGDGDYSLLNGDVATAGRLTAFDADFRFADFPPGSPNPIDWDNIDYIVVLFQSGSGIGGNDFAVTSITATNP